MKKYIIIVGLDVHKNSIDFAFADTDCDGARYSYGSVERDPDILSSGGGL